MLPPLVTGCIVFGCLVASATVGRMLRAKLPDRHLSPETKDTVRVSMGMVATMSALVLGLLVAAAKTTWDDEHKEVTEAVAQTKFLDGVLTDYGPDAAPVRAALRYSVEQALLHGWPGETVAGVALDTSPDWARRLPRAVHALAPGTDEQRALKAQAVALTSTLGQIRWLIAEQSKATISRAILLIVVFWMAMIFVSLGIFAPPNGTSNAALVAAALSVAGATFLILELSRPFIGFVRISSEPLREALAHLSR